MVEKAKKRLLPLLLTVMLAALLAVSGASILGVNYAQAQAGKAGTTVESDGMDERVDGVAAYSSPSGTTSQGYKYWNFPYNGGIQSLTGMAAGYYKLEVWGAAGGNDGTGVGGRGGYSVGMFSAASNTTLYVGVGGAGGNGTGTGGGYNGGGHAGTAGSSGAGGGATHIAKITGTIAAIGTGRKDNILIVAGGGGGGGNSYAGSVGNYNGGAGGGATGKPGAGSTGGGQNGGGSGNRAGTFGQGGNRGGDTTQVGSAAKDDGGGGGGGWYGGGASIGDGGGAGGSGYIGNSQLVSALGVNKTCYDGTQTFSAPGSAPGAGNETGHSGAGYARITQMNVAPTQNGGNSATITVNRTTNKTITVAGTATAADSLRCADADGDAVVCKAGIYMSAATTTLANSVAGNNYWITWAMTAGNGTFSVRVLRYWSGTKAFYIQVTDSHGHDVWVKMTLQCSSGDFKLTTNTNGTSASGNPIRRGLSTTTSVGSATAANAIYNPLGANRPTIWLGEPLVSTKKQTVNIHNMYASTVPGEETVALSTTVTYQTTRYNADTGASNAINTQAGATNSSNFTKVEWGQKVTTTYYNGSSTPTANYERGKRDIVLSAKPGLAPGNYYYVLTVTVQLLDKSSGVVQKTVAVDIVYRVENLRPELNATEQNITLRAGESQSINVSALCTDPDGNTLTIADVVVPTNEFVLVDTYGKVVTPKNSSSNYNVMANTSYGNKSDTVLTTAQTPNAPTGFNAEYIYKVNNAAGDAGFASSQTQGNNDVSFLGYYLNAKTSALNARTEITLVANKASRLKYANAQKTDGNFRVGHFYILVRVIDSGAPDDEGIWFPIAVTVQSAAPQISGVPSISGAAGSTHYVTPFGVRDASYNYFGIGTPFVQGGDEAALLTNSIAQNGGMNVMPFAYDADNYSLYKSVGRTVTFKSPVGSRANAILDASADNSAPASFSQREAVFLTPDARSATNTQITAGLPTDDPAYADRNNVLDGFKEFFTISRVRLYARTSVLLGLTDDEIETLHRNGIIYFMDVTYASNTVHYVGFDGLAITLKKSTMGSYLKVPVDVTDTHNIPGTAAIAVNVTNTPFSTFNADKTDNSVRNNSLLTPKGYNPRGKLTTRNQNDYKEVAVFEFTMQVGDKVLVSPYDLFYDPDTYTVNNLNSDGSIASFNTVPNSAGHSEMLTGVNKKITVYAGSSAADAIASTTPVTDFKLKKLTVAPVDQNPSVSGGGTYGTVKYFGETPNCAEYFEITASRKTPSNGFLSFSYVVTNSAGETATAEIHLKVDNSLPVLRPSVGIINLSASPALANSSSAESNKTHGESGDEVVLDYFVINSNTYNVREYTLNDLFIDPDGDRVKFTTVQEHVGIEVGTKNGSGEFVPFGLDDEGKSQNVFVNAYIGAGSNNRSGYNNCLIIRGLSSTQGVPGGVWIRFYVMDDAIGTYKDAEYILQVEVHNSTPEYADMTGSNAMEDTREDDTKPHSYLWRGESDSTNVIVANLFKEGEDTNVYPFGKEHTQNNAYTSVEKPLYIASNDKVMDLYKTAVNTKLTALGKPANYNYTSSQVRYIAQDPDEAQGLVLHAADLDNRNTPQTFNVMSDANNPIDGQSAVGVNDFYNHGQAYLKEQNIVQILFFDDDGNMTTDPAITHVTSNWIVAFNLTTTPTQEIQVKIRLRDGNRVLSMPVGTQQATAGGHSVSGTNAYVGDRGTPTSGGLYEPKISITDLYNSNGIFSFSVKIRAQGIIDNMTRWASTDSNKGVNMNNVWTAKDADKNTKYYNDYYTYTEVEGVPDVFRYEGIDVGASGSVAVPVSYFSWAMNNITQPARGTAQRYAAYYDIADFRSPDPSKVMEAFTISDGFRSWTGSDLYGENNNCPYVTFGVTDNMINQKSKYLDGQQRFLVPTGVDSGGNKINPIAVNNGTSQYFLEDEQGVTIKKNKVRSVGSLKLIVRMTLWSSPDGQKWSRATDIDPINITVPLTVANTPLQMDEEDGGSNMEYDIAIDASTGYNVILSSNKDIDEAEYMNSGLENYKIIASDSSHDQATFFMSGNTNPLSYREDVYFFAHSLTANFTSDELNYIAAMEKKSQALHTDAYKRVRKYFGVDETSGHVDDVLDRSTGETVLNSTVKNSINKGYTNYFTVAPSGIDSKSITIVPSHITTFDYSKEAYDADTSTGKGTHKEWIVSQAATRGLKVEFTDFDNGSFTVKKIYYPLKVMVYDSLSVGTASNRTHFSDSAFDVITLNVEVRNSHPEVLTRNLDQTINVGGVQNEDGTVVGGKNYAGRRISLGTGKTVSYGFSEILYDANMVFSTSSNRYLNKSEILGSSDSIVRDTGDYLHAWENGDLVKVEFLEVPKGGTDHDGAITVKVDNSSNTFAITVNKRVFGFSATDIAAYVKLTFADRYYGEDSGSFCEAVIEVHIANAAPTLTAYAQSVRNIEMETGQYFTLYATQWTDFIKGAGNSNTVGKTSANSYDGTYFADMKEKVSSNSTYMSMLDADKLAWTFGADTPHVQIGKSNNGYEDTSGKPKKSLGYMAMATDDAPWTLRIDHTAKDGGVSVSDNGKSMIKVDKLNYTRYESSTEQRSISGYTAVMFEALGACEDVTVSVTLTDGNASLGDKPLGVVYTFKITVKSTPPKAITLANDPNTVKLGANMGSYKERLSHNEKQIDDDKNIYDLKMKVGESISMRTSDFATDKDKGDTDVMYLLGRSGSDPFMVTPAGSSSGMVANSTPWISLKYERGTTLTTRNTMFTVTATNFHNESNNSADNLYDTVVFYICDPYSSKTSDAVEIELRIHVYPSEMQMHTSNATAQKIAVAGVTDTAANGAYAIPVVSKNGEGGLTFDADAGYDRTRYSVTVYSMLYYATEGEGDDAKTTVKALSSTEFANLVAEGKQAQQIVAKHTISRVTADADSKAFSTDISGGSENYKATQEFISSLSFSPDGTVLYVVPAKATNGKALIANSKEEGFQFYIEVEKFVERETSGSSDFFDPANPPAADAYEAQALAQLRVENSAAIPLDVTDSNFNARGDGNSYFEVNGTKGSSWDFLLYNKVDTDVALFTDPDGDELTYKTMRLLDVFTLDSTGANSLSHINEPGVRASAENALSVVPGKIDYVRANDPAHKVLGTFGGFTITVRHKVEVAEHGNDVIYLKFAVAAYDVNESSVSEKEIVVGISNSAPKFKYAENVDGKYNSKFYSYDNDGGGTDAYLTLTLGKDETEGLLEHKDGWLEVPLMDFIDDTDYDAKATEYKETFTFVNPESGVGRVGLAELSGDANGRFWLENGAGAVTSNVADAETKRFNIKTTADNLVLRFKTNSYERGAKDSVTLIVKDSSGAKTGSLTITLVVGNSKPIDRTQTEGVSKRIVLKGGKTVPEGSDVFPQERHSIFEFVTDKNPDDVKDYGDKLPENPTTFITISGAASRPMEDDDWHPSSVFEDENEKPSVMVSFVTYDQYFTVAPQAGLYGVQEFVLTVHDGGNSGAEDSQAISVKIEIEVKPNPNEVETNEFKLYWRRTMPLTAKSLFDDPNTDGDESTGYIITGVELTSNPDNAVTVIHVEGSDVWSLRGDYKDKEVTALVSVVVGNSATSASEVSKVPIKITVVDNKSPYFREPFGNKEEGGKKALVKANQMTAEGIYEVPVSLMFEDAEGDELRFVSAKTVKSTLISVTTDTQNNSLRFHFKGKGDTKVEVKVADAVATYSYSFTIFNDDLPSPNFFIGMISRVQSNPLLFIIIFAAILLFLIILIIIIAAIRKKKKMREEIEALLVSEMELEEQMLKLAAGPSPVSYQSYGYLPPTPGAAPQNPGMMLGSGQGAPDPNAAIGLNPGAPQNTQGTAPNNQSSQLPPPSSDFNDEDL